MNQTQLEAAIAARLHVTKKEAKLILDTFKDIATEQMTAGKKITLPQFGSFERVIQDGRYHRNPNTGETIWKEAHGKVKFEAYKKLKEAIL